MFVKTQYETIINLAKFSKIYIELSKRSPVGNFSHIITAVSSTRTDAGIDKITQSETLAEFPQDMQEEAKNAYDELFTALLQGEVAFDMKRFVFN